MEHGSINIVPLYGGGHIKSAAWFTTVSTSQRSNNSQAHVQEEIHRFRSELYDDLSHLKDELNDIKGEFLAQKGHRDRAAWILRHQSSIRSLH